MNPEWFTSQRVLQCLGDESRFRVMTELVRGDRCVTELATLVGLSQSCTTRHLQVLERAGLVSSARSGKRVVFCVRDEPRVAALLAWALPMEIGGDLSRILSGSKDLMASSAGVESSAAHESQPVAPERLIPMNGAGAPAAIEEARPGTGSRGERARPRELEDFLL